jgi:hypothetical protein
MVDLLERAAWGASVGLGPGMPLPAQGVHVHHSVTVVDDDHNYGATGDVAADMREIEAIGKQRFGRFPYSYCGHPSGWVGVGAALTIGAHTAGWNSTTFGYCLIGNYDIAEVTDAQVRAFIEWRHRMVSKGWLRADHWIEPHRARKATACPGGNTMRRWDDLTAPYWEEPLPPPVLEDDDMPYLLESTVNRGIWLVDGQTMTHLAHHESVSAYLGMKTKSAKIEDADFLAIHASKTALAAAVQSTARTVEEILKELNENDA